MQNIASVSFQKVCSSTRPSSQTKVKAYKNNWNCGLEWVGVGGSGWEWVGVGGSGWEWVGVSESGWEHCLVKSIC